MNEKTSFILEKKVLPVGFEGSLATFTFIVSASNLAFQAKNDSIVTFVPSSFR
jgi:hypothetical protein